MKTWSSEKISTFALVLLITGAIDSIRNLPTTALFGSSLIFFFILSAIVFLIPCRFSFCGTLIYLGRGRRWRL